MDNFLSQEEIDALLRQGQSDDALDSSLEIDNKPEESKKPEDNTDMSTLLTDLEKDALGEIGNISMGSASTTLSEILQQKVVITTPKIKITSAQSLYDSFNTPYVIIDVNFTEGLNGSNILVIKTRDAAIIADLMMGGTGENPSEELSELQLSAVAEAMNQMIGSAATSMTTIFNTSVKIAPPIVNFVDFGGDNTYYPWVNEDTLVVISFTLRVGNLIDSEMMQVIPIDIAKEEADMLFNPKTFENEVPKASESEKLEAAPAKTDEINEVVVQTERDKKTDLEAGLPKNLNLILDVPLKVSVILGKTRRPIQEVLNLIPGSIVELERLANEPVDILVNGTLIAQGEVVVINENYGVRVTNIISPEQRLNNLRTNE